MNRIARCMAEPELCFHVMHYILRIVRKEHVSLLYAYTLSHIIIGADVVCAVVVHFALANMF